MKRNCHIKRRQLELFENLKQEERQWQDEIGNDLIEKSYMCAGSRLVYDHQFENIISRININQETKGKAFSILEIGCGRGQFLDKVAQKLTSNKIALFGLDLSSKLVEVKQKYENRVHWIIADGEMLPFSSKTFDVIVYNGSLHHMPDFKKSIHEAFRIIGSHGHIILYEPIAGIFSRAAHSLLDPFVFKKTKYESPVDEHCKFNFRLATLQRIITDAGYDYTMSWHDFLAYPFTGCYAGSYFSKKPGVLKVLLNIESLIHRIPLIKNICNFFCWRVLIDIYWKKT